MQKPQSKSFTRRFLAYAFISSLLPLIWMQTCNYWAWKWNSAFDNVDPSEIVRLRRSIFGDFASLTCLDRKPWILSKFKDFALSRVKLPQHMLHIPKAGGTSVCHLAQSQIESVPRANNCWHQFCPFWCCCFPSPNATSCNALQKYRFEMNEQWIHYPGDSLCENVAYSILIRDPIRRTLSNLGWAKVLDDNKVSIISNNYVTWALASGKLMDNPTEFFNFQKAGRTDFLDLAIETLTGMDVVIDLTAPEECRKAMLRMVGLNSKDLPHERNANGQYIKRDIVELTENNQYDLKLYELARDHIIKSDCEFYKRIFQ